MTHMNTLTFCITNTDQTRFNTYWYTNKCQNTFVKR